MRDLATLISDKTGCGVRNLANPRKEDAENELDVCMFNIFYAYLFLKSIRTIFCMTIRFFSLQVSNKKFCSLGLNPITLELGLLDEVVNIAGKYQGRCDMTKVLPSSFWNKDRAAAAASDTSRY